ncbi:IclR family transcriptional regulator [Metasolibacillus sp.]|uniref:IclR family transcriptional regulator n=1 Tax=Metasolibacillus sp. TaxID=2703680 RepID=UPI0025FC0088|nr:IclR family transcriptional regulator [Metasolibacillus sp.]MCT6922868.1 IclR family transcriptional regulator [Metasolibacillus sp.]MCT6938793.1 IclR family transcriptional regulator [Metasolibacillus sp.]
MLKTLNLSIAVLRMFTKEKPTWGGRELAVAMGLNHTNLYRILETFEMNGFITKDPVTKKYSLGIALWELGMNMYDSLNIDQLCIPILENLQKETGETAIFTVLNGLEALTLLKVEPENKVKFSVSRGSRTPLYVGASYRSMLAYLTEEQISQVIDQPLIAYTERTMIDAKEIRQELENIRINGYAVSQGEYTVDVLAVAMPIFNSNQQIVASVTVSGPLYRFTEQKIGDVIEPLARTKKEIESIIGRYHLNFN